MEANEKACPFCAETILAKATVCKHCKKSLGLPSSPLGDAITANPRGSLVVVVALVLGGYAYSALGEHDAKRAVERAVSAAGTSQFSEMQSGRMWRYYCGRVSYRTMNGRAVDGQQFIFDRKAGKVEIRPPGPFASKFDFSWGFAGCD